MADLEELYREIILDHYRSPRNRGELDSPPAHRVEGFNPLCGDEVVLSMVVEDGTLADLKIGGSGCSISQSSASLMSAAVKGKPVDEVRQLINTFKGMMSIHEATLDHDGDGRAEAGAGGDRPRQARRAGRAPGRREVPGAHQVRHPELERPRPGPRRGGRRGLLGRAALIGRCSIGGRSAGAARNGIEGGRRRGHRRSGPVVLPPVVGAPVFTVVVVVGAVAALAPRRPLEAGAGAAVVGVTAGGGLGYPAASGGGLVGVTRLEPKTLTSICWAAGWSTVSTSPRSPNPLAATVGRVCACRLAGSKEW